MPQLEHRPRRRAGLARTAALGGLAGLLAVLLGGAASSEVAAGPGTGQPTYLRTAHLLTGSGPVDVRLTPFSAEGDLRPRARDGALARTASYGAVDSYAGVAPGTYAVTVAPSGADGDEEPLLSGTVTLAPGRAYTVVALGPGGEGGELTLLEDDLVPPPAGQAEVRLFSAVPRARVALDGGPVAQQVPPSPDTGYVPVPAGDRLMEVSDGVSSTSLTVGLASRSSYTVFVRPGPQGALGVQAVLDQAAAEQAPVGGVDTGGGWLATQDEAPARPTTALLLAGGLVLAAAAVVLRTTGRTVARTTGGTVARTTGGTVARTTGGGTGRLRP